MLRVWIFEHELRRKLEKEEASDAEVRMQHATFDVPNFALSLKELGSPSV